MPYSFPRYPLWKLRILFWTAKLLKVTFAVNGVTYDCGNDEPWSDDDSELCGEEESCG